MNPRHDTNPVPRPRVVRRGPAPVIVHHHYHADKPKSDGFAIVLILTLLFWPLGVVAALVYLLTGRMGYAFLTAALTVAVAIFCYAFYYRLTGG